MHPPGSRRRRIPQSAAVLAVIALLSGGVFGQATAAHADVPAPMSDSLVWGIKESWRNYVGNGYTLSDGATVTADGLFAFPVESASYDADTRTTEVEFSGSVRFQAYCDNQGECQLDSEFANLRVVISSAGQSLYGDYVGNPREGGASETVIDGRLATLDIHQSEVVVEGGATTWTGVSAYADTDFKIYDAGTVLDQLSFSYLGDGGKPDLQERWDAQGAPVFSPTGAMREVEFYAEHAGARTIYVSEDSAVLHTVEMSGSQTSAVYALDAETLESLGEPVSDIPAPRGTREVNSAYDSENDALYLVNAASGGITQARWNRDAEEYEVTEIAALGAAQRAAVRGITWNSVLGELAVIYQPDLAKPDDVRLLRFSPGENDEWDILDLPLPMPNEYDPAFANVTSYRNPFGSSAPLVENALVTAPDGAYLNTAWATA